MAPSSHPFASFNSYEGLSDASDHENIIKGIQDMCKKYPKEKESAVEIPPEFICPLTKEMMKEPVKCLLDGIIYEKESILKYLRENRKSPSKEGSKLSDRIKGKAIGRRVLSPAKQLKLEIEAFKKAQGWKKAEKTKDGGETGDFGTSANAEHV